jgi:hypothetical protein
VPLFFPSRVPANGILHPTCIFITEGFRVCSWYSVSISEKMKEMQQPYETCNTILAFRVSRRYNGPFRGCLGAAKKTPHDACVDAFRGRIRGRPHTTATAVSIEAHRHLTSNTVVSGVRKVAKRCRRLEHFRFSSGGARRPHFSFDGRFEEERRRQTRHRYSPFPFCSGGAAGDHIQRMWIDSKHDSRGTKTRLIHTGTFRFNKEFSSRPHVRVGHKLWILIKRRAKHAPCHIPRALLSRNYR